MLGLGVPDSVCTRRSSVRPEKARSFGENRHSGTINETANMQGRGSPVEPDQELAAGEIYTVDKLLQSGFQVLDHGVPSLRLRKEPSRTITHSAHDAASQRQPIVHGTPERRSPAREGEDRLNGEETRRMTRYAPVEHGMAIFSEGGSRFSMESVWGSSSGIRSAEARLHFNGKPAAAPREKRVEDRRAEVIPLRYLLGGEKAADGRTVEEATFRCIKSGAGAAAARKRRFRQANACARLAAWARPPGDTAFHRVPPTSKPEGKLKSVYPHPSCPLFGGNADTRNYHLHAQKPPLPTGPARDSLEEVDVPGVDEEREKLDVETSFIFLNPRTHRLERKQATVRLAPTTGPTSEEESGKMIDASNFQSTNTFTPGKARAATEELPLLTSEKSIERTAKLLEAFERCRPDAAGWLLTDDIRWTLPRDIRVQEIFGLTRKSDAGRRRKGRAETEDQAGAVEAETGSASFACWRQGESVLAWAKDLLRNRDEPVRLTRLSQTKYEAMLRQLRRVESSLINNDRITDAPKISFDIFCRAFWQFLGDASPGAASYDDEAFAIAVEKQSPYMLTPMQMLVRDALLGVRMSPHEIRLPDYVECGQLPLMERPDLTLAEEGGTLLIQPDERRLLREQLGMREEASSFEKTYSLVLQLEKHLAEREVIKKSLGKYSRMRFLSLSAEELEERTTACANTDYEDESCTTTADAAILPSALSGWRGRTAVHT